MNFLDIHETTASKREPTTSQWFLESSEYTRWLTGTSRNLFCEGIPGAGKTYLASLAIDDLRKKYLSPSAEICVAWVYRDYAKRESQNATSNMCSILQQLVAGLNKIPQEIACLYKPNTYRSPRARHLDLTECRLAIIAVSKLYSQVFIVIDALDECHVKDGNRDDFVTELKELPENTWLFTTCRQVPTIEVEFPDAVKMDILAQGVDIENYVSVRLKSDKGLAKLVKADNTPPSIIKNKVIERSGGM